MTKCTWEKDSEGRYICMAKRCHHWLGPGKCALGKVSLNCLAVNCQNNENGRCKFMDASLGEDGRCQQYRL